MTAIARHELLEIRGFACLEGRPLLGCQQLDDAVVTKCLVCGATHPCVIAGSFFNEPAMTQAKWRIGC
ncbi:hypothetical protein [Sulfuricaulis limicola]|nr:hypothetical protein [Sulfuricaulis limicola]